MEIKEVFSLVGNKVSESSAYLIKKLSEFGLNITEIQSKILSLISLLGLLYFFIRIIEIPKKAIKYSLIIALIILIVSIIISFL